VIEGYSKAAVKIPKIIHQTWKDTNIPSKWLYPVESCKELHKPEDGWEYKLWTDESAVEFIRKEYPKHLDNFMRYPYPIQRADAIRYFILYHYGGVYYDLDVGCRRSLEPLTHFAAVIPKTEPIGYYNLYKND
jgi:mannosyltransferase OCH1-like enzyme